MIWCASSRVGAMINAVNPRSLGGFVFSDVGVMSEVVGNEERYFSRMGIPKARVLPEPVEALPTREEPERISGMAEDWIGVGLVNFRRARARRVGGETCKGAQAGRARFSSGISELRREKGKGESSGSEVTSMCLIFLRIGFGWGVAGGASVSLVDSDPAVVASPSIPPHSSVSSSPSLPSAFASFSEDPSSPI